MAIDRNVQARQQFNARMRTSGGLMGQPGGEENAEGGTELSEQDKKVLADAVQVVGQMLYSDKVAKSTAEMIRQPPHVKAIGDVAAQITNQADQKMDVPEDLIIPLGVLVAEMVSDIGEELGFYKEDEKFVNKCVQYTIKKLYEIYGTDAEGVEAEASDVSPEELQGAMPTDEDEMAAPPQGGSTPEPEMSDGEME